MIMTKNKKDDFNAEALLKNLKAARDADPNWEKAIAEVVDAEVKYGKDDPAQGRLFIEGKPHPASKFTRPKRSK